MTSLNVINLWQLELSWSFEGADGVSIIHQEGKLSGALCTKSAGAVSHRCPIWLAEMSARHTPRGPPDIHIAVGTIVTRDKEHMEYMHGIQRSAD